MTTNATAPPNREQEALTAYLKLLKNKGADEASLNKRQDFLMRLFPLIQKIESDGLAYRESVEHLLDSVDRLEWPFSLAVAREYFHFWIKDFKSIAALNADAGFDVNPIRWQPVDLDLKALWKTLDSAKFVTAENWPLKAYNLALRQAGAELVLVETRTKLVKILLIRLREAPQKSSKHYRVAVDSTVPLFEKNDTRRLFFAVVREFYYFWIGDPDAADRVTLPSESTSFV
ncbi:MAG: hypothetical protein Q8J65_09940 [Nitrosomonadales bacterium]|nr:hypothetical protein [Nitrosomonadales bacterium]